MAIPEQLGLQITGLLGVDSHLVARLHAEGHPTWTLRHALLGPVVRCLHLLNDHWAYRGIGTLRQEPNFFLAGSLFVHQESRYPVHELQELARLILAVSFQLDCLQAVCLHSVQAAAGLQGPQL